MRRLLDQQELDAVRIARRESKSWAEIATYLGVTRQSAWERWRDLDEQPERKGHQAESTSAAGEVDIDVEGDTVSDVVSAVMRERRRRSTAQVPSVLGLEYEKAREVLAHNALTAISGDPGTPLPGPGESGWIVTDQSPEGGARVPAGSPVRLWLRRDGGSGVREPRHPFPPLRSIPELPEPSGRTAD
ncbi:hypothetical protein ABIA39_005222 [Nocardia sp. GAS34]|uniref:PASTA domain-containing protein n=1 Tax=unclassified Nocardia TaxID=2637762 RepID=UPI003D1A5B0C